MNSFNLRRFIPTAISLALIFCLSGASHANPPKSSALDLEILKLEEQLMEKKLQRLKLERQLGTQPTSKAPSTTLPATKASTRLTANELIQKGKQFKAELAAQSKNPASSVTSSATTLPYIALGQQAAKSIPTAAADPSDVKGTSVSSSSSGFGRPFIAKSGADGEKKSGKVQIRFFQPKARIYFDIGTDDANEIDIFRDGALVPTVNIAEAYIPFHFPELGPITFPDGWTIGPAFGFGITAPADDSDDNTENASGAPVLLLSAGILVEFPVAVVDNKSQAVSLGIEFGYVIGFTTQEGLDDIDDSAIYAGLTLFIDF